MNRKAQKALIGAAAIVVMAVVVYVRTRHPAQAPEAAADPKPANANFATAVNALAEAKAAPPIAPKRPCADGTVPEPGAMCDSPVECRSCEKKSCDPSFAGCEQLKGEEHQRCVAVLNCVRSTGCANEGPTEPCLCGTAGFQDCLQGKGDGPCKAEIENAGKAIGQDPTARAEETAKRYFDPRWALGRAMNLVNCDHDSCKTECKL